MRGAYLLVEERDERWGQSVSLLFVDKSPTSGIEQAEAYARRHFHDATRYRYKIGPVNDDAEVLKRGSLVPVGSRSDRIITDERDHLAPRGFRMTGPWPTC